MRKCGTESVSISLDSDLISALEFCCFQRDITRSQASREALKLWIAQELSKRPDFWERVYYGVNNNSKQKKIF